jgi:hypothetical protein
MSSSQMPFAALIQLRKLCNHPDLVTGGPNKYGDLDVANQPELDYGAYHRSGKMIVVRTLLRLWFEQGQKVLLFSQSRQMLTIIEQFIILEGFVVCSLFRYLSKFIFILLYLGMNICEWTEQLLLENAKILLHLSTMYFYYYYCTIIGIKCTLSEQGNFHIFANNPSRWIGD